MFPPHVARLDDAFDYLVLWCDIIGGEPLDGIDWEESEDASGRLAVRVRPFRVRFGVGTILRASFATTIGAGSAPASGRYSFDLRLVDDTLVWRHDCHPGHERLGTGCHHLHVGPTETDLRPDGPQTLETIFERVTTENLRRSWDQPSG